MDDQDRSPRVLVVDDDENVLRLLSIKLKRAGFAVDIAVDVSSALTAAHAAPPDLAVLGDDLPDGDAHELARKLVGQGDRVEPAVVFLSTRAGSDEIRRALEGGADDYVLKPFSPHDLIHRLRVALIRRRLAAGDRD